MDYSSPGFSAHRIFQARILQWVAIYCSRGPSLTRVLTCISCVSCQQRTFANKVPSSQGYGFTNSLKWMWELDYKESWVPKNWCFWTAVLEKTLESPLDCKEIQPVHPKVHPGCSLEGLMLKLKLQYFGHLMGRHWCWERLKAGGERDDRGWDGWMASLTQWAWVWVNSRSWWWTGWPGVLQSMGTQRVGHDWATELSWMSCWHSVYVTRVTYTLVAWN